MRNRRSIEISATSVEDAVALALDQLGATLDEVEVEVLRESDEPDEHGFISDEALVLVSTFGPRASGAAQPVRAAVSDAPAGDRPPPSDGPARSRRTTTSSRRTLTAGERMHVAQLGQEALSDLLHYFGLVASCHVSDESLDAADEDALVVIEVEGEDLGVLIGRRGENLDAMQYILNLIVQKHTVYWPSIQVDVEGYRRRRVETLELLARRMARTVSETQQPFTFEPMSARERRIVHVAVSEDDRVSTESTGEGDDRRVVIYPAR